MSICSSFSIAVSDRTVFLRPFRVSKMHWVTSGLLGVALLQRAEAGWHEHFGRDIGYEEPRGGFPTTSVYPAYTHGSPLKQDETMTFQGPDWLGQQETLMEGNGVTSLTEHYSFPSLQPSYEPPRHPGSSLLSLATILRRSSPPLRSALLRNFIYSVARLRTRHVGLGSSVKKADRLAKKKDKKKQKHGGADKNDRKGATERRIAALASKFAGVIGAAEGATESEKKLAKFLFVPFRRLVQETEELLSDIAMNGDAEVMIVALDRLAPPLVRGLSYLEAPQSEGAAEVLEPARDLLLERARELDTVLLEAQADPEGVMRTYTRDFTEHEIEREKQLAMTAIALIPPVVSHEQEKSGNRGGAHRRRRGKDKGDSSGGQGGNGADSAAGGGSGRPPLEETLVRHRDWIREQRHAFSQTVPEHTGLFEHPVSPGPYTGGHFVHEPGSPLTPHPFPPHYTEPYNVHFPPPGPSAPPMGPPFQRIVVHPPPPPYEEAMRPEQTPQ
ncbi:uncharacterized protein EMH_0030970 [Eimeria mitis]|uniref:Uncharacterized protein n=1 Tax=Eimeria mitis TaxID=44415 RepID=U6JRB2_9EIME|nr:uncharacterized protein EMH_0030970 [Eimeria mitis]CDJ27351.1 hypothetical protein, conserved [Eimeria mitis]